jgi:hypothetical protein
MWSNVRIGGFRMRIPAGGPPRLYRGACRSRSVSGLLRNLAKIIGVCYRRCVSPVRDLERIQNGHDEIIPNHPRAIVVLDQSLPELNGVSDPAFGTRIDAKSKAMPNIFVITVFDHRAGLP